MHKVISKLILKFNFSQIQINPTLFFSIFQRLLTIYFIYFFISLDWSIYATVKEDLFSPLNGLGILINSYPKLSSLRTLLVIYFVVGGMYLWKPNSLLLAVFFLAMTIYLDLLHNSFGFVNVQTHAILFLIICCFRHLFKSSDENSLWFIRAIEIVFVMVYFQSALSKLVTSGWAWALDGTTLQIALTRQLQPLGVMLSEYSNLCIALSVATLLIELLFPALYFLWPKKYQILLLSISFHLATYLLMGIHFFHLWVFPLSYILTILAHQCVAECIKSNRSKGLREPSFAKVFSSNNVDKIISW